MADRQSLHRRFADAFHVGDAATPATDAQLDTTNAACDIALPASFRAFAKSVGDAYTPNILDAITERNLEHPDVQNFMPVTDIPDDTAAYWQAGMPGNVVAFASDCMGNLFVFPRELHDVAPDDAPVLFFDHDFSTVETVAVSFDAFLLWFLDNIQP